ncbi:ATP-binding protein [Nostoc sp. UIC 10890]
MDFNLQAEIKQLVATKREGQYWDFKEKHHDNKASLLHDILCLANSLHKGNKYLIFGVGDPQAGCEIKGVEHENRKSQTDLIDFLRSKPFAGDIRPEIELRTFELESHEIDVLIIFDKPFKPYYLRDEYRDRDKQIRANSIYTRNIDTNTPIDKSADIRIIEMMWRERFGLDVQPSDRIVDFLWKPEEWDKDIGNKECAYHKYNPEYQIKFGEPKEFRDIFSYFYINKSSFIGEAEFKYLSTTLFTLPYMYCDEMRIELAVPSNGHIRVSRREVWYIYYVLQSRNGAFLNFMTDSKIDFQSRGGEAIFLLYRNHDERKEFENYLSNNLNKLDEIDDSDIGRHIQSDLDREDQHFIFKPVEMVKVKNLFEYWRVHKDIT